MTLIQELTNYAQNSSEPKHAVTMAKAAAELVRLEKDKERLDWLLKKEHRDISIVTHAPAGIPDWKWSIELRWLDISTEKDGRLAIDSAMQQEKAK